MFFQPEAVFRERANAIANDQAVRIRRLIPEADIQHIGGTAVTGALTKGDVDLSVTLSAGSFAAGVNALRGLYRINQPENWTATFASFKDDESFALPFGAQLVVHGAESFSFVRLRDGLKSDASALEQYNAIKRAHQGSDPTKYRAAKSEFIARFLAQTET